MIRVNEQTPIDVLNDITEGNLITDTFSKTGLVESIEVTDDPLYRKYTFHLVTGRTITIKK